MLERFKQQPRIPKGRIERVLGTATEKTADLDTRIAELEFHISNGTHTSADADILARLKQERATL
jgi:hypothetical protein